MLAQKLNWHVAQTTQPIAEERSGEAKVGRTAHKKHQLTITPTLVGFRVMAALGDLIPKFEIKSGAGSLLEDFRENAFNTVPIRLVFRNGDDTRQLDFLAQSIS